MQRDRTLDLARGLAIIAVVASHSWRGLFAAGLVEPVGAARWFERCLYLTHLPVFAFATGLLMPRSVDRQGRGPYLRRRLELVAYLYVLWTLIQGSVEVVTSSVKNVPTTWTQVIALQHPLAHLWFLPALALGSVLVVLGRPWRERGTRWVVLGLALVASVAGWGVDAGLVFTRGWDLVIFFMAGAALTHERLGALRALPTWALGALGTAGIAAMAAVATLPHVTLATALDEGRTPTSVALGVLGSTLGVVGVVAGAAALARVPRGMGWLARCGELSLPIYLAHIVATAGVRIALVKAGVAAPGVHLLLGTLLGVAVPILLYRLTARWPWLFSPPWQTAGTPPVAGAR